MNFRKRRKTRNLKNRIEFSRDKCKVFKQNESSAQIIFRKALGVILDTQQNRS